MSSTAGHGAKVSICDVKGCECEAERSLNLKQLQKCSHLCKEHYKQYKKETKTSRAIDAVY